jgi:hypothetical protein
MFTQQSTNMTDILIIISEIPSQPYREGFLQKNGPTQTDIQALIEESLARKLARAYYNRNN